MKDDKKVVSLQNSYTLINMSKMIEYELQQSISQALRQLYNLEVEAESVVLQKTKKEFEGDITVVVL